MDAAVLGEGRLDRVADRQLPELLGECGLFVRRQRLVGQEHDQVLVPRSAQVGHLGRGERPTAVDAGDDRADGGGERSDVHRHRLRGAARQSGGWPAIAPMPNTAPWGSATTAPRPKSMSFGGIMTVPPSSVGLGGRRVAVVDREPDRPRRELALAGRVRAADHLAADA